MKKLVSHLSYSRVVSTLALFLALGGGAYAVSLGKNDVKSRNISKGAVKSSDVAKNTLRSSDVRQDSLKGSDILEGTFDIGQFTAAASTPVTLNDPIKCDPGLAFASCGQLPITIPVAGRILVIASGELISGGGVTSASCRLDLDGQPIGQIPLRARGDLGFGVSGVSAPVPAGAHSAELRCSESGGQLRVEVFGITAALVAGG